jgi:protein gp37
MTASDIEWTNVTWNPVTGCTKISAGCQNCYAAVMARRLKALGLGKYRNGFDVTLHPSSLEYPYSLKKGQMIFVNSMSDLFHKDIPIDFIQDVFKVMNDNPQHRFQVLTKRAERILELNSKLNFTDNIWLGVSVENQSTTSRIEFLANSSAKVKFLSIEPLLDEIKHIPLIEKIDWIIVGGESGPKARPMLEDWVLKIKANCEEHSVPFFFKQWGGVNKKKTGRLLLNQTWDALPLTAKTSL